MCNETSYSASRPKGEGREGRLNMGGIKYTENLALISIEEAPGDSGVSLGFFRILSENEINISMLSRTIDEKADRSHCSVSEEDLQRILRVLAPHPEIREGLKITRGLGALSIYPHRSRIAVLGSVLKAFAGESIPVYNMVQSISTYTFLIDQDLLEKATRALEEYFILPENHSPFKRQICIKHIHR